MIYHTMRKVRLLCHALQEGQHTLSVKIKTIFRTRILKRLRVALGIISQFFLGGKQWNLTVKKTRGQNIV